MMKRLVQFFALIVIFGSFIIFPSYVQAESSTSTDQPEPFAGLPICIPGVYLQSPRNCLALGPSSYLTDLARQGLYLPVKPLPTIAADKTLNTLDESYLKISQRTIYLYDTLEDAVAHSSGNSLTAILLYLAKSQRVEQNGKIYYELTSGYWIDADQAGASCCVINGSYQGLIFSQTPHNSFGWTVDEIISRNGPSYSSPETGKKYYPDTVVQIYSVKETGTTTWYMVGPDEWIDRQFMRPVDLQTTPPTGVTDDRWIEINLYNQTMSVYDHGQLVYATMVATGMAPFYTRPGLFQIENKKVTENMSGAFEADRSDYYYLEDVPWTMYYDEERALHGAYWRTLFGYPQSHGCVNLSPGDAHWLFDWANVGDWVYVWDPSGKTPTDPSYFGPGGA
jgi:hypothetical protein